MCQIPGITRGPHNEQHLTPFYATPLRGWPVCGYQVSHNRQYWSGLVQEEPGRNQSLPTQVLKWSLSYCVTTTCAGYMTQRLICQETREESTSTSGSFQCLAHAECLQNKTEMGAQKRNTKSLFCFIQCRARKI